MGGDTVDISDVIDAAGEYVIMCDVRVLHSYFIAEYLSSHHVLLGGIRFIVPTTFVICTISFIATFQ